MIQLNLSTTPKFLRPELLLHPPIPKDLSGVNPRTIKGQEWWDVVRKEVYAENNFCCWACGTYQLDALYKPFLDAHETYTYDYEKFEAYPGEVVGLCRACHWFIHFRRVKYPSVRQEVILRGLKILVDAGLQVPYWQWNWINHCNWPWGPKGETYPDLQVPKPPEQHLHSSKWVLVLDEVEYNLGGVVR